MLEVFPGWRKTISRRFDSLCRFGLAITSKARAGGARLAQVVCEPEKTYAKIKKRPAGSVLEMIPPFAATCRAEPVVGAPQHSRCLVDVNIMCVYRASPFNLGPFCLHPRHLDIVARTAVKSSKDNRQVVAAGVAGAWH